MSSKQQSASPRISVAMATYNGEKFVREQLDSLSRQTLLPFELVVTDDGSTDSTMDILEEFSDSVSFPVRVYRNAERLGFADNFLKAASLCKGELIAFCDQDDSWFPCKLEYIVPYFTDERVLLAAHTSILVDQTMVSKKQMYPYFKRDQTIECRRFDPFWSPPGFSLVVRRELLGIVDNSNRPQDHHSRNILLPHDKWAAFLAMVFGRIALISKPLAYYRQHGANVAGAPKQRKANEVIRESSITGSEQYWYMAKLAGQRAAILDNAQGFLTGELLESSIKASEHYRSLERFLRQRAKIYTSLPWYERVREWGALIKENAYVPRTRGGLGARALLKDTVSVLLFKT